MTRGETRESPKPSGAKPRIEPGGSPSKKRKAKRGGLPVDTTIPIPVRERAKTVENTRRYKWNKFITAAVTIIAVGTLAYYGGAKETVSGWINQIKDVAEMATEMPDPEMEELVSTLTPSPTESPDLPITPSPESTAHPEVVSTEERLTYPITELIHDETLCRNSDGKYELITEPVSFGERQFFRVTVLPLDENARKTVEEGMMLQVIDPEERVRDKMKCLAGMPNGGDDNGDEETITFYVPVRVSEKSYEQDTAALKLVDRNNFHFQFPGLVMIGEGGTQTIQDNGNIGIFTFKNPKGLYEPATLPQSGIPEN